MSHRLNDVENLVRLIDDARHLVVLTGAGISTLSGIPDFRGKNGFYTRTDIDTQKIFDINAFYDEPEYFYAHSSDFLYNLADKTPNVVHTVLAQLERQGKLQAVITQNIDLLHQKAGSRHVLELHGSPAKHYCLSCRYVCDFEAVLPDAAMGKVPHCPECGGVLKPRVVFFGESLPVDTLSEAQAEAEAADLMLVLGTSLTVYPAAAVPEITLNRGGRIAIVNADPTPLDQHAAWVGQDLRTVFEFLEGVWGSTTEV